ncbi:hypothetical protein SERLADRAFT_432329 [Serpula lacrymans var. lacrymans S7.9]|uniref:Uncharacterized protein n=1 Tax=Serpula lacrymans var. lacrymans (strain S7.9) TaxID=578457 RepID=F8NCW8_SERL9|nr:uncharacterized protein SERLADRAFT_432329 [Serpula lacrymans var. lacrymans S7.9]EGO30712.1 hypothetical protein SERLADRAFT_432329 [Serpula lacrymans var. lacrymans S7.9]
MQLRNVLRDLPGPKAQAVVELMTASSTPIPRSLLARTSSRHSGTPPVCAGISISDFHSPCSEAETMTTSLSTLPPLSFCTTQLQKQRRKQRNLCHLRVVSTVQGLTAPGAAKDPEAPPSGHFHLPDSPPLHHAREGVAYAVKGQSK